MGLTAEKRTILTNVTSVHCHTWALVGFSFVRLFCSAFFLWKSVFYVPLLFLSLSVSLFLLSRFCFRTYCPRGHGGKGFVSKAEYWRIAPKRSHTRNWGVLVAALNRSVLGLVGRCQYATILIFKVCSSSCSSSAFPAMSLGFNIW